VYCAGRIFTYVFLGAVAGFGGQRIAASTIPLVSTQRLLAMVAGVVMLLVGVLALAPGIAQRCLPAQVGSHLVPAFRQFLGSGGRWGVFVAGVANGFLPCGLVYALVAMCMAGASVASGMLLMMCFGAGTVPAMTLVGCGSTLLSHRARLQVQRVAACLVIVSGVVTIQRGWRSGGEGCCADGAVTAGPVIPARGITPDE
jgi:sulfite exporter TauE/SafE